MTTTSPTISSIRIYSISCFYPPVETANVQMEEFFMLGFCEGGRRTGGFFAGEPFFLGKERFPRTPSKESRFYAVCPAEGGSGRIWKDAAGDEGWSTGGLAGEPFFLEKEKFPRTPSKESRFYAVCPAKGESGRGVRAPAPPSVGRTRVPAFLGRAREGPSFS